MNDIRDWTDDMPISAAIVTAIAIFPDGTIKYAQNKGEKRAMFKAYTEGTVLLAAWTGQYRTDIFHLPVEQLAMV